MISCLVYIVVDDLPVVWMLGRRGIELRRNPSGEFPARLLDVLLTLFVLVLNSPRWRRTRVSKTQIWRKIGVPKTRIWRRTGVLKTRIWRTALSED